MFDVAHPMICRRVAVEANATDALAFTRYSIKSWLLCTNRVKRVLPEPLHSNERAHPVSVSFLDL